MPALRMRQTIVWPGQRDRYPVLESPAAQPAYQAVLIGSAQALEPVLEVHARVTGVVLAAGRANRLGRDLPKQLLPWNVGNTLVGHVVDTALASRLLHELFVVTGYRAEDVAAVLIDRPAATLVTNPDWPAGQSSSVRSAVQALPSEVSAVVFMLADQPSVRSETIDLLVESLYAVGLRLSSCLSTRVVNPAIRCCLTAAYFPESVGSTGRHRRAASDRSKWRCSYGSCLSNEPQPQGIETMAEYWQHSRDRNGE